MANLRKISVLAFALAIASMLVQVAVAMPALEARQATCAVIPGLTNSNDVRSISPRQAASNGAYIPELLSQSAPCIPNTVDVSPLTASVAHAQSNGHVQALSLGSFLKKLWKDFQDVLKVIKDVEAVILYGDVVDILKLLVDGYQLYTDVKNTFLVAKGPNGDEKRFTPVKVYKEPVEKPCGYKTGRICPKSV